MDKEDASIKIGAIMGLGLAYAGSQNDQVSFPILFQPIVSTRIYTLDLCKCWWHFQSLIFDYPGIYLYFVVLSGT